MTETAAADSILVGHVAQAPILECAPEISVAEAVASMCQAHRGSIVAVIDGHAAGILTVEDIIRLDFDSPEALARPVAEVMSSPVKSIRQDATLREAAFRFRQERIRHLLVADVAERRIGIVSQTDVVNHQGIEFFIHLRDVRSAMHTDVIVVPAVTRTRDVIRLLRECKQDAVIVEDDGRHGVFTSTDVLAVVNAHTLDEPVSSVAHFPLQSLGPDASLFQARSVFMERRIRHLGVMEGERLIGLLTYGDIMACVEQVYLRDLQRSIVDRSGRVLVAQQALALARVVSASVPQGVVITDSDGLIESVNPPFTAITGYAQEDVAGKNMRILNSGRHDEGFFRRMFAMLAERGVWSGEIWNRRKDGELFSELLTITVVRGIDGAISNYVGVFSNITAQKREQEATRLDGRSVEEQEKLYHIIVDTLPVSVFVKDEAQRYLMVNDSAAAFLGLPKDQVRGKTDQELFPHETAERLHRGDQAVLDSLAHRVEENVVNLHGAEFCLLSNKRGIELGGRRLLIGSSIDISSRRLAEQRLADERELLELIAGNAEQARILETICRRIERYLHGAFVAVMVLDEEGGHLRCGAAPNLPAAYAMAIDGTAVELGNGSFAAAASSGKATFADDIAADPTWQRHRDLAALHSLRACWSTPVFSADRRVLGTFDIYFRSPRRPTELDRDLVEQGTRLAAIAIERAQASAQLHRMATIDTLTGLPNRPHFFSLAQREFARLGRNGMPLAAFMIDVDHFKQINDTYGHAGGDSVLRALAARVGECVRSADICGRLGGEEFAVLLPETDQVAAIMVADRLRRRIGATPVELASGKTCRATVSVGVAILVAGDGLDRLLSRADETLYAAKHNGRDHLLSIEIRIHRLMVRVAVNTFDFVGFKTSRLCDKARESGRGLDGNKDS